jgi:hypothetical protein
LDWNPVRTADQAALNREMAAHFKFGVAKVFYEPDLLYLQGLYKTYLAKRNIYVGTSLDDIFDISASDEGMSWNDTIDGLKEALAENISRAFPVLDEYADNDSDGITFAMMISISWFALMFFLINAMLEGDKGKAQKFGDLLNWSKRAFILCANARDPHEWFVITR